MRGLSQTIENEKIKKAIRSFIELNFSQLNAKISRIISRAYLAIDGAFAGFLTHIVRANRQLQIVKIKMRALDIRTQKTFQLKNDETKQARFGFSTKNPLR